MTEKTQTISLEELPESLGLFKENPSKEMFTQLVDSCLEVGAIIDEELASKVAVNLSTVTRWRRGRSVPSQAFTRKMIVEWLLEKIVEDT